MAFGKIRHSQILSEAGNTWDVEIWQQGFDGSSIEFSMQGEGFEITWSGEGETLDTQFLGSELKLNYYVQNQTDEDFMYNEIFKFSENKHYIRIYKTEQGSTKKIWWYGWLVPAFDTVENNSFPYVIQLTATDSYGFFKSRDKDSFYDYNDKIAYKKITQILGYESPPSGASATDDRGFFGRMQLTPLASNNHPAPVYVNGGSSGDKTAIMQNQIQWWRKNSDNSVYDFTIKWLPNSGGANQSWSDPFFNYYFTKSAFSEADATDENGELILPTGSALEYKESDVFNSVLKCFNATGFLSEGSYLFRQPLNFRADIAGTIVTFPYESTQQLQEAISTRPASFLSSDLLTINQSSNVILANSSINFEPAFRKVTIDFDEGFSIANVVQGTALDTRVQIGTMTSQDQGPIALSFSAIATEVIAEPFSFGSGSTPRYTVSDAVISAGGIRTHSRLKISLLLPNGNRIYLRLTVGSNELTWGSENVVATLNIFRGNDVYNDSQNPLNNTNFMADSINMSTFNGNTTSGDLIKTRLSSSTQRTTTTLLEFNCSVQKPPQTGLLEIEMDSRNATTGDFTGYYSQAKHISLGQDYTPFPTAPTFVSNKTEVNKITFDYTDLDEGESVTSVVTYGASQTEIPSSKVNNLGTSLLGQTPISPLTSIAFKKATKANDGTSDPSVYPIMNETDQFEIQPSLTGFVRGNPSTADPLNLLRRLTKERLSLQSKPLEILQADIFSASISPSKLIKYSLNSNTTFKYYVFKGGTFKAQSDTMSGEWFMVKQADVTINTTRLPGFPSDISIILQERLAQLSTRISQQDAIIESISVSNSFTTLTESRTTKVQFDHLDVVAIPASLLSSQGIILSMPDGSSPVNLALSSAVNSSVTVLPTGNFTLDQTYPVGSLVRLNQANPAPTP